jgi:CO/xanthine dehydrogenase Mo-binding subunit
MMTSEPSAPLSAVSRRTLLQLVAGSGLCLAAGPALAADAAATGFGVYLRIAPDGGIRIETPNAEMGQGTYDGLAKIVVEELDADWQRVEIALSGENPGMVNPRLRGQTTGNSEAVRGYFPLLSTAGAAAREMLVAAAAARWGVAPEACRTEAGMVTNGNRRIGYGALAEAAARLPVPQTPTLKARADYRLLGRDMARKETAAKVRGHAVYGIDVERPGMKLAALAMPDAAYGSFAARGLEAARAADGVVAVVPVRGGHAVVADDWWTAKKAAALISFEAEGAAPLSTDGLNAALRAMMADLSAPAGLAFGVEGGKDLAASRAAVAAAEKGAAKRLSAEFSVPYLAHGTLEPMCCTAQMVDGLLTLWAPTQGPGTLAALAQKLSGLAADKVVIHRTFLGGGFGRRWNSDYGQQAIELAMALPGTPVKLIWSREQDGQHDFYRPASMARIDAGLTADGSIAYWNSRIVGQSLIQAWRPGAGLDAPDYSLQSNVYYQVTARHQESSAVDLPVPIGYWRSVAHMPNAFFTETVIDELALLAGMDPLAFRLQNVDAPRSRAVLEKLGKMMGWPHPGGTDVGHGVALTNGYDSYCAVGARVRRDGKLLRVEKLWAVMDCGFALEPENVRRQVMGAMAFGLGPMLEGQVVFEGGVANTASIGAIGALTPNGMPLIEVELLADGGKLGGAGEVAVPGVAPAVCNALVAAGGPRVRALPLTTAGLDVVV